MNCQSINNKIGEFEIMLQSTEADIVMGCESWLDSNIASNEIFSDFSVFRKHRNRHGGGVFIAYKNDLVLAHKR